MCNLLFTIRAPIPPGFLLWTSPVSPPVRLRSTFVPKAYDIPRIPFEGCGLLRLSVPRSTLCPMSPLPNILAVVWI